MSKRRSVVRSALQRSGRFVEDYVCPSCTHRREIQSRSRSFHRSTRRNASTISSTTAINAPSTVPPEWKPLLAALEVVNRDAANYINLSRLQLAVRGLNTGKDATVRIAILGVNGTKQAKQVARLLLADPLADIEEWEKGLQGGAETVGMASILLTYGSNANNHVTSPSDRLLPHRPIPSRTLHKHRIEVIISTLNAGAATPAPASQDTNGVEEVILAPALDTPTSASGRVTQVTYPVHKAIIIGDGVDSLVQLSHYLTSLARDTADRSLVKVAISLPGASSQATVQPSTSITCIDPNLAGQALDSFRESLSNSTNYERGWLKSGMPLLSDWFIQGTVASSANAPKGAVTMLIQSLLNAGRQRIESEGSNSLSNRHSSSTTASTRASISEATTSWAENAHTELRDQLDLAFAGKHWRRLAWWKLLWRVDDVGMLTAEVLERRWLPEAEKGVIYLAGRLEEAGLLERRPAPPTALSAPSTPPAAVEPKAEEKAIFLSEPPMATLGELQAADTKTIDDGSITPPTLKPWPMTIPYTRHTLQTTMVPRLQSLAQKLVLQTLSTSALSIAIAAAAYTAVSTTTVYEAGAVAAFGLVFSLRKLQRDWEGAREAWEGEVREEGRTALKETEEVLRGFIRDGGKGVIDEMERDREVALRAIEGAERALQELVVPEQGRRKE